MKEKLLRGAKIVGKGIRKKSPLLLTIGACVGVAGVIFTTAKATVKIKEDVDALKYEAAKEGVEVSKKDIAKSVIKHGWPIAVTSGTTIACTVANHKITSDRIRTATTAYEFYRDAYSTYKEKVRERIGDVEDRNTDVEIAKDRLEKEQPDIYADPSLIPGSGVIFIESISGQVFRSSVDDIRMEEKYFNDDLKGSDWLSVNEWIEAHLGLNPMSYDIGEKMGFGERFDHDGLTVRFTPSDKIFATGETATLITYEENLVSYNDYTCLNC